MKTRFTTALAMLALPLALAACDRPRFNAGQSCTLNTDCAEPLVCGLERCRRQCVDSRDCAAGLLCLRLEGETDGVCQLPEEVRCSLTSECTEGLTCRFGTCTTECVEDRDCPPGATCQLDDEQGARACMEMRTDNCIYHSDCGPPLICGPDQRCRYECMEDRDCDPLRYCSPEFRCMPRGDAGT
jgi:hypothetical protein